MLRSVLPVLLALTPALALAQKGPEVTPFFGLRSQGSFRIASDEIAPNLLRTIDAQKSVTGGVFFDYGLTENFRVEALWTHQGTEVLLGPPPSTGDELDLEAGTKLFDIGIDYLHGGVSYGGGAGSFRPYVAAGIGTAIFNADLANSSRQTHLSFSLALGFRSYVTDRIGFRFDARAFGTRAGDKQEDVACGIFGCAQFERASTFWQGHFVGGLVIAF